MGVIEVFNKYMRQDDIGHRNSVAPTLVTYNLVRYFDSWMHPWLFLAGHS